MPTPIRRSALGVVALLAAAIGQTPSTRPPLVGGVSSQDFCSSSASCYTPARGPQCPQVRFGWGNCPGSRQACDWCYGPNGVFAYSPRGSVYTLASGCNQFSSNTTWSTQDSQVAQWMKSAGGNCTSDGRGGYSCSNVDAARFQQAANCGNSGGQPPQQTPPQQTPPPQQAAPPANASSGNCSCYTPARGPQCPQVRFGWGDCPGSRQACDWCYGPNGVFAYSPRGSVYTLSSGCTKLGPNTVWSTQDAQVAQSMKNAGGNCSSDGRGGYTCSNVDPARYRQTANCGGPGCGGASPGSGAAPISGTLPPTYGVLSKGPQSNCPQPVFTYFYINGINTPMTSSDWRGNYVSEYGTVGNNLIDDRVLPPPPPFRIAQGLQPSSIQVSGEVDKMYGHTHNPSGKDPWNDQWIQQNCTAAKLQNAPLCTILKQINDLRAGSLSHGFSAGDLYESFRQSINLPSGVSVPGVDVDGQLLQDATVVQVIQAILTAYYGDQSQTQHYFIVVAHSQGNFFAEAIAKYMKDSRQEIYEKHLGIISLASPTSYESLKDPAFVSSKIVHHTRSDDAINAVATIGKLAAGLGLSSKKPWTANDPPLWPWPLPGGTATLGASHNGQPRPDLFSTDQLLLSCDPAMGIYGCMIGRFFGRLGYSPGITPNPELYTPLLNSHLLDNYMDKPAATQEKLALHFDPSLVPWVVTPGTTSVLDCVRRDLIQLKKNLLNNTKDPTTSICSGN